MPWLQKRPQVSTPSLFYTTSASNTIVIAGLGNLGKKYEPTRHNIGFKAVDAFVSSAEEFSGWTKKADLRCLYTSAQLGANRVIAIKPTTFMNDSGLAIAAVLNFYKVPETNLLVIHDDIDVNFGQIRIRQGGADAGHNGIKSITEQLGNENYGRIRVGIGPKQPDSIDSADFVLAKFGADEIKQLANLYKEVSAILSEYVYGDNHLQNETRSFIV